jgi:hypothetical protein
MVFGKLLDVPAVVLRRTLTFSGIVVDDLQNGAARALRSQGSGMRNAG